MQASLFVFDIGASLTRVAIAEDGRDLGESVIYPTPADFATGVKELARHAKKLSREGRLLVASGGIAGPLDRTHSQIINATNLPGWNKQPLKEALQTELGCPIMLENDTALVGLGEATVGAGKHANIVAYLTVSTGVNGVRITRGRIDPTAYGFEIGYQIIDASGGLCPPCQPIGQLEAYLGGKSLEERTGTKPQEITDERIWEEAAQFLAYGLVNTAVYWSPELIVIGGSMMKHIPLKKVETIYQERLTIFPERPRLVPAVLGDIGGLHGALACIRTHQP